jgi:hypothetical protein
VPVPENLTDLNAGVHPCIKKVITPYQIGIFNYKLKKKYLTKRASTGSVCDISRNIHPHGEAPNIINLHINTFHPFSFKLHILWLDIFVFVFLDQHQ